MLNEFTYMKMLSVSAVITATKIKNSNSLGEASDDIFSIYVPLPGHLFFEDYIKTKDQFLVIKLIF